MTAPALAKSIGGIRHYPTLDGGWVPSVTAILGCLDTSVDGLLSWASNIGVAVGMEVGPEGDLADAKRIAHARRRESAKRGDAVHAELETAARSAMAGEAYKPDPWALAEADEIGEYVKAGLTFMLDNVAEVLAVEVTMLGDGYAGSCDLVVRLTDGRVAVVDWKTGKQHDKHLLQLAAYWGARDWVEQGDDGAPKPIASHTCDTGIVVYLKDDGTYRAVEPSDIGRAYEAFEWAVDALGFIISTIKTLKDDIEPVLVTPAPSADAAPVAPEGAAAPVEPAGAPPPVGAASAPSTTVEENQRVTATAVALAEKVDQVSLIDQRRAWVRGRVAVIEHHQQMATLMTLWPAGVLIGDADDVTLDAMAAACSHVEQQWGLPLPDPDPRTDPIEEDDPRVQAIHDLHEKLPIDLFAWVDQERASAKIPGLWSGRITDAGLAAMRELVDTAHTEHAARVAIVREAFDAWPMGDLHTVLRILGIEGGVVTEDECEHLVALAHGGAAGVVRVGVDENLCAVLEVDESRLMILCGDSKSQLLKAGKAQALRLERPNPKSSADVVADPILAGAVAGAA